MDERSLADRIDDLLPQTQCGRCGYGACRPYAEAVAAGQADINRCPPGGAPTVHALAELLEKAPKPLDPECGETSPPAVATIDEAWCIGCTICLQVCPVDAIVGASRQMHTVIDAQCTGCELCVDPCPVDCIRMVALDDAPKPLAPAWRRRARGFRQRYRSRQRRLERERARRESRRCGREPSVVRGRHGGDAVKKAVVAAAVARVRTRRAARRRSRTGEA